MSSICERTPSFPSFPLIDDIQPSGVIHMMSIELSFDPDTLRLERIQVDQPFVAIEVSEKTGGERGEGVRPGRAEAMPDREARGARTTAKP